MTADARIGADVANVFRSIGVGEVAKPQENILNIQEYIYLA